MPLATNSIGEFQFEELRGSLQPRSQDLEILIRPGKDDSTVRLTGVRGKPFQVLTLHYVADFLSAKNAISAYVTLQDGNAYEVVQLDESIGYFRVLAVVEVSAMAVASVVGDTLIADPEVLQYCQWTLQHVPNP
jgi:hypothetical protein